MKAGNLSTSEFDRTVTKFAGDVYTGKPFSARREGLSVGEHIALADKINRAKNVFNGTITGYTAYAGAIALNRVVTKVYCSGIKPEQAVVTIIFPETYQEKDMRPFIICIKEAAELLGITIPEFSIRRQKINLPEITVAASGTLLLSRRDGTFVTQELSPWLEDEYKIIFIGTAAAEGAIILREIKAELLENKYSKFFLKDDELKNSLNISKVLENETINRNYMLAIGEGGIFAALWEMSEQLHLGMKVDLKSIRINPLTVEICETLDVTPYSMMGGGVLLVTNKPDEILDICDQAEVKAEIIGSLQKSNDKLIINEDEVRYLDLFRGDSLVGYLQNR